MNARPRTIVGAAAALAFFVLLALATFGLPHFGELRGPAERERAVASVASSHATNLDAFVNFDSRGFDTLGEETIFLTAIAGFSLLLQERRGETRDVARPPARGRRPGEDDAVEGLSAYLFLPLGVAYALYVVIHGQLTPGGGFQGGVLLASTVALVAVALGIPLFRRLAPKDASEATEALGSLGYVVVGIATLATSGVFLRNDLPHGETGSLLSSGTILLLNDLVGIAVGFGFLVLFAEFLTEMLAPDDDAEDVPDEAHA